MTATVPWPEIAVQWREREFRLLREAVARLGPIPFDRLDALLDPEDGVPPEDPATVLRDAFAMAESDPSGPALLATYMYGKCLDKWERSEAYGVIRATLEPLRDEAERRSKDDPVTALVAEHAWCQLDAMDVERGLNCSCPIFMQERAERIVDRTGRMLAATNGRDLAEPAALLTEDARTQATYFGAVAETARSVLAFLYRERPGPGGFAPAIERLLEAERHDAVRGDVYESELRAHRATLVALEQAAPEPRLWIDAAEITYIYPFAFTGEGIDPREVVRRALAEGGSWRLGRTGIVPGAPLPRELTSVWYSPDSSEQLYRGALLPLPDVAVTPTADRQFSGDELGGDYTFTCQAEICLSTLGNHFVRVRMRAEDMDLHDLNQTLRRASRSMGDETLTSGDGTWGKFVEYANDLIHGVARALSSEGREVRVMGDPSTDFHVVIGARSLSAQHADGTRTRLSGREVAGVVGGSLLLHPVRSLATSLEEWVRYPTPEVENLREQSGYSDDLVVRTANTTVLYMPSSPEWSFDGYEEMAEFVAALPPLLAAWEAEILAIEQRVKSELPELRREVRAAREEGSAKREARRLDEILEREASLRELETYVRQELAQLHSRRLVRDHVHREFLDRLWDAAGTGRLEEGLERQLEVINTLNERLSTLESSITERNRKRAARYLELVLAVIAVISLTDLFGWINGEYGFDGDLITWGESAALVGVGVIVALIVLGQRR